MKRLSLALAAIPFLALSTLAASGQTDREAVEGMQRKASLACPDYSTDRGNPGIAKISVDALRVLAVHKVTLCPDRRIKAPAAVIWYPRVGALAWNPSDPAAVSTLAAVASKFTRTEDFPQGLAVYDTKGTELKNQIVPQFTFKETYGQQ